MSLVTATGQHFDLHAPTVQMVNIVDIAYALSNICRFTGHCNSYYSVAQHSVLVARLLPPDLALAGLLHDAAEAYLGDVATPLKSLLPDYRAIEARVEAVVLGAFGLPPVLPAAVKQADQRALATEVRDLMRAGPDGYWDCLRGVRPDSHPIRPLPPQLACDLFMRAYRAYQH